MEIYISSHNDDKVKEIQRLLNESELNIQVRSMNELSDISKIDEVANTFEGNARLKAQALIPYVPRGAWVLADDSGLMVEVLNGAPGIHSSRYAAQNATDEENCTKLLSDMSLIDEKSRDAKFLCCFVLLHSGGDEAVFLATVKGKIANKACGKEGFGYDPLFIANGYKKTFAELGSKVKDKISHRAHAVQRLVEWLKEYSSVAKSAE